MKDAALACLGGLIKLGVAMGFGIPETDPRFRQLFEEFCAKRRALSPSDVAALEQLATAVPAWLKKVEATRLAGAAGDPRLRRAPDGDDWLWRPVVAGMCRYESLIDGTLDLADVLRMNTVLDIVEENKRRTAGDAALPLRPARSATPTGTAQLQAAYDARLTNDNAPTLADDHKWAADQGILQEQVTQLRKNNKDPRLHKKGRRARI
jgi:hypothetical protein